jgi:hypothetical protein
MTTNGHSGVVAGAPRASVLDAVLPEQALDSIRLQVSEADLVLDKTREVFEDSRRALKAGRLELSVPAPLAGGRLGWIASAGEVREVASRRLRALQADGRLSDHAASLIVTRFGLHGYPGGATEARRLHGRGRQATSDAINEGMRILAADIAMQPLLPVSAPSIDRARREEIVGTVLSTLHGPAEEHSLRRYVHARVREKLLGDPLRPISTRSERERRRWNRTAHEWIAVASDHLDRDRLPWSHYPRPDSSDRRELEEWRSRPDRHSSVLSTGGTRALSSVSIADAFQTAGISPLTVIGFLADGYRPLIELTRVAQWARTEHEPEPELGGFDASMPTAAWVRAQVLLALAQVVALRGYHHLALAYAGSAVEALRGLRSPPTAAGARSRFESGLVFESISYLRGPSKLSETRAWQERLAGDLDRHGVQSTAQPLALAQAMIRAEHSAALAGVASGKSVRELLEPIRAPLDEAFSRSPGENRTRLTIVIRALANEIGDKEALRVAEERNVTSSETTWIAPSVRYDEWYCAWSEAMALWDRKLRVKQSSDQWRR